MKEIENANHFAINVLFAFIFIVSVMQTLLTFNVMNNESVIEEMKLEIKQLKTTLQTLEVKQ